MNEKRESNFLRDRFLSLFDNIVANAVIIGLGIAIPAVVGFILKLEVQITLLIVLLVGQVLGLFLLFRIQKNLSSNKIKRSILVRNDETNGVYLIDDFGLPHLIRDENTLLYFMDILGYKISDIPQINLSRLKPIGADITSIRDWRPPRTIKDDMSAEARTSLKIMPKSVRVQKSGKVISFDLRNDNEQVIQVNSAKLFFDLDAPLTVSDISPRNEPKVEGLLTCKLLFDGNEKSKSLLPQKGYRLDLFLNKDLSDKDVNRIVGSRFGYIEIKGVFRDTEVSFHLYA